MNYRYWKERCQAEQTDEAVRARQLFYQGTLAYKTGDFSKAAAKYREGLQAWKQALNDYPTFKDDDLCRKDTGLILKRYVRALQQADEPMPDDTPFKDTLVLAQNDPTVDPFDADRDDRRPRRHVGRAAGSRRPSRRRRCRPPRRDRWPRRDRRRAGEDRPSGSAGGAPIRRRCRRCHRCRRS